MTAAELRSHAASHYLFAISPVRFRLADGTELSLVESRTVADFEPLVNPDDPVKLNSIPELVFILAPVEQRESLEPKGGERCESAA